MNCLARYDRELYLQITGKPEDPFYNDDKIEAFTAYCLNYWAQFGPETEQQRLI